MTRSIRVPDPVYESAQRESDRRDVSIGAVVEDWKRKADRFEELEATL